MAKAFRKHLHLLQGYQCAYQNAKKLVSRTAKMFMPSWIISDHKINHVKRTCIARYRITSK